MRQQTRLSESDIENLRDTWRQGYSFKLWMRHDVRFDRVKRRPPKNSSLYDLCPAAVVVQLREDGKKDWPKQIKDTVADISRWLGLDFLDCTFSASEIDVRFRTRLGLVNVPKNRG